MTATLSERQWASVPADETSFGVRRMPLWECALSATAFAFLAGAGDSVFRVVRELDYYAPLGSLNEVFANIGRIVLVLAAVAAARNSRATITVLLKAWPLVACIIWAGLSAFWSLEPASTLRKVASVSAGLILVAGLVQRYGISGIVQPVRYAGWFVVCLSFLLLYLSPHFAFHDADYPGAFRGIFLHKNALGVFLVCVVICALAELGNFDRGISIAACVALLIAALVLLFFSQSLTGLAISAAAVLINTFLWYHRSSKIPEGIKMSGMVMIGALLIMAVVVWDRELLQLVGRDATLTGRTILWQITWQSILDRPLLGYGYGAYWLSRFGDQSYFGWVPWHAHNGYLDMQLGGGIILTGLIAVQTLYLISKSTFHAVAPRSAASFFIVLVAALLPIYNLVESIFIKEYSLPTALYAAAVFLIRHKQISS